MKLSFIRKALNDYMLAVESAMERSIQQAKAVDSGQLLNSLKHKIYQQYADGNGNLSFAEWGRYLDIGVGRGHPLGGLKNLSEYLTAKSNKRNRKRKPKKIYSPIVYGHLNGLIGDLSYGFTEETVARLKAEMESGNTPSA